MKVLENTDDYDNMDFHQHDENTKPAATSAQRITIPPRTVIRVYQIKQ